VRILAACLILANLMLYLAVHRLPAVEPMATPEINLPRVTRIEILDSDRSASPSQENESRCVS